MQSNHNLRGAVSPNFPSCGHLAYRHFGVSRHISFDLDSDLESLIMRRMTWNFVRNIAQSTSLKGSKRGCFDQVSKHNIWTNLESEL